MIGKINHIGVATPSIAASLKMYADLFGRMWELHERGRHEEVRDAYGRFLLMRNLNEAIPGTDLYVMRKRGVFKTAVRRTAAPSPGAPQKLTEFAPTGADLEEIEFRFAALKPFLTL